MTFVVTEYCRDCKYTDCVEVCPVDAFHEGPDMLYINPVTCIDCDLCVESCPVEAIFREDDIPEEWKGYIETNAKECKKYEVISTIKAPLPTAKTLDQILADKRVQT